MPTTGLLSFVPPADPQNGRLPKVNTPPSAAAKSYPIGFAGARHGPANVRFWVAMLPLWSPKATTQWSPAACCAAVGGQGYLAASVAASLPAESVPDAGG